MHIVVYSPIILYIIAGVFLGTDTQIVLRYTNTQEGSERGFFSLAEQLPANHQVDLLFYRHSRTGNSEQREDIMRTDHDIRNW